MKSPRLYRLLAALNAQEMAAFDKYVRSPYVNQHQDTIRFWELIAPGWPAFAEEMRAPERQFEALFPGTPFEDVQIRTLRKYLLRLLERFLIQRHLEKDSGYRSRALLTELHERELYALSGLYLEEAFEQVEAYPYRNEIYYQDRFFLNRLLLQHQIITQPRLAPANMGEMLQPLDHAYVILKLSYACAMANRLQQVRQELVESKFLPVILAYCAERFDELPALAQAYYLTYLLITRQEQPSTLDDLMGILAARRGQFHRTDLLNLFVFAINYCNYRYRAGAPDFLRRMFNLYQRMLDYDLLFEKGLMSSHQYKNLSTLGLRLGEYDWTEQFILRYQDRIDAQYRESVVAYNLAHLHTYRGQYREAMKLLRHMEFIEPFYRISYYLLLLKIYYECREVEPLVSLAQSFQAFLQRKQAIEAQNRRAYVNFVRLLRRLFLARISESQDRIPKLESDIRRSGNLIERDWLVAKLEEWKAESAA
jgi:hypothetical protein